MVGRTSLCALFLLGLGVWGGACSSASTDGGSQVYGGAGPGSASAAGGSGAGGFAGTTAPPGAGGSIDVAGGSAGNGGAGPIEDACAATSAGADVVTRPADLIWAVDQSGSMDQETQYVAAQINNFVTRIDASGIDYRVVMIAATSGENALCVPGPLANNCGNAERFRLVNRSVDSHDALKLIVETYPQYSDFLRPNATKHFIVVTDDDATGGEAFPINSAQAFTDAVAGLQPAQMFAGFKLHGVYAYGPDPDNGCDGAFGEGANYGYVYEALIRQTGGAQGVICEDNWQPVFDAITTSVVDGSKVSCEYTIPPNTDGGTLDSSKVNVDYLAGGQPPGQPIYRVNGSSECTGSSGGWHFDDNNAPTKILLCPSTCSAIQSDDRARVEVKFGCISVFRPPA